MCTCNLVKLNCKSIRTQFTISDKTDVQFTFHRTKNKIPRYTHRMSTLIANSYLLFIFILFPRFPFTLSRP